MLRSRAVLVGLLVVVVLLAGTLVWTLSGRHLAQDRTVVAYRVASTSATTMTLVVNAGACDRNLTARVMSETARDVVVAASATIVAGQPCAAYGVVRYLDVTLDSPVDGRTVYDGHGGEVDPEGDDGLDWVGPDG